MTNNNNPARNGSSAKAAGRLSMISVLAISAGLAAAPAQAQSVIAPSDMPMQSPVAVPQSAPAPAPAPAPAMQSSPVTPGPVTMPAAEAKVISPATPDRAQALATRGGFDATTVAPEALAEIESEQQARQAAAARAAAEARAAAARTAAARSSAPVDSAAASGADRNAAAPASSTRATEPVPIAGFGNAPAMIEPAPAPESAPAYADLSGETDWTLLAALAGLLGIGGVGAYAATRRRKSKAEPAAVEYADGRETESAAIIAATMPELRRDPVEAERRNIAQPQEQQLEAREHLTDFVAGLPSYEAPRSKADRNVTIGQRRVAAAPRPYLGEADLSRRSGYFMAHVDAIPTPQNPFLTRQKRLKRARHLDRKLAEIKAANALKPTSVNVRMHDTRPLEPAYS